MPYGGQLWFPGGGGTQQPTRNEQWGGPNTVFPMPYSPGATIIGAGPVGTPPIQTGSTSSGGIGGYSRSNPPPAWPGASPIYDAQGNFQGYGSSTSLGPPTGPGLATPLHPAATPTTPATTPQTQPNMTAPTAPFAGSSQPQTGPGSWMQRILTLMGGPQGSWGSQFPYMSQDSNFSYDPYY